MRYYVYRKGYNAANNPVLSGGPETVLVAEVEADSAEQAVQDATDDGVTCYHNQTIWATDADKVDARNLERGKRVRRLK